MADQPPPPVLFQCIVTFDGEPYQIWGTRVIINPNHQTYGAVLHNGLLYVVTGRPIQGGGGGDGGDGGGGDGGGEDGNDGDDDPLPRKRSRGDGNAANATREETGGP